ncbi:hypothetical protein QYM36_010437 [Artemia franciscana]|uniref:Uncharacterized protein n=2 Tax=Artemia franciscana TaxID=6661 RepID=A0AA88HQ33_ARTSF|nr:hypothetical protein QYM36_010437 [Artemia franciscana]
MASEIFISNNLLYAGPKYKMLEIRIICILFVASSMSQELSRLNCPPEFKTKCACGEALYYGEAKWVVNCTDAGFRSVDMLEFLPEDVQVLIFTGNDVKEIPPNVFGDVTNYEYLEVIDMSNNKIRHIRGQAFHRISNVHRLILNHNDLYINGTHEHPRIFANMYNLKELHLTNAFTEYVDSKKYLVNLENIFFGSNLAKLEKLHLEQNEIWMIPNRDMFCQLPALMDLYLGDNKLSSFDVELDCLKHLRYIDLESNMFAKFTPTILRRFDDVNEQSDAGLEVNLRDNYFICDCDIKDFQHWLKTTKVSVRNKEYLRCRDGIPSSNIQNPVIDAKEMLCAEKEVQTGSETASGVIAILCIILTTLVAVIIYMNVAWVRTKASDVAQLVKKRSAYSSLLTQPEDQEVHV